MKIRSFIVKDASIDMKRSNAVLMYFLVDILNLTIKNVLPVPDFGWSLLSYFFILLMFIAMLIVLPDAISKKGTFFFLSEGLMLGVYVISYFRGFALNDVLFIGAFWTLCVGIPLATLIYSMHDYTYLLLGLKKIAYLSSVLLWLVLLNMKHTETYNMPASYALVIPTLAIIDEFFKRHRIIDIFFPAISVILIVLWGARGPLLCIGVYIMIYFFFYFKPTKSKALFFVFVLLILLGMVFAKDAIMKWLTDVYLAHDMVGAHTIGRFISGKFLDDSGRDVLVQRYMYMLNEHPILGLGLYGGWDSSGNGPHNMLVEYLVGFGYPIGMMLCTIAVCIYISPLLIKRGVDKQLLLIFLAYNVPMLWVRGVWTEKPEWFMFVAMVVAVWKRRKNDYKVYKKNQASFLVQG